MVGQRNQEASGDPLMWRARVVGGQQCRGGLRSRTGCGAPQPRVVVQTDWVALSRAAKRRSVGRKGGGLGTPPSTSSHKSDEWVVDRAPSVRHNVRLRWFGASHTGR